MIRRLAPALGLLASGIANAVAQEPEPPAPWRHLDGRNAGAVGTCSLDEPTNVTTCYLVRCEAGGLVFVIQASDLADFGVRRMYFEIGRFRQTFPLPPAKLDEQAIDLSKHARLLTALNSGIGWANVEAVEAATEYGTGFELTDAPRLISELRRTCRG